MDCLECFNTNVLCPNKIGFTYGECITSCLFCNYTKGLRLTSNSGGGDICLGNIYIYIYLYIYIYIVTEGCKYLNRVCTDTLSNPGCTGEEVYVKPTSSRDEICIDGTWQQITNYNDLYVISSCYEINNQLPSLTDGFYYIKTATEYTITYCLGTSLIDGPFTRIYDIAEHISTGCAGENDVNDLGMSYNKLYFVDKGNTISDLNINNPGVETTAGFSTSLLSFVFNNTYYYFTPTLHFDHSVESPKISILRNELFDRVDVISPPRNAPCIDPTSGNLPNICFSEFKMHLPQPTLSLSKITDVEITGGGCTDNEYKYDFDIYVGNCHSDCSTCLGSSQCLTCYPSLPKLCPTVDGGLTGSCKSSCDLCTIDAKNTYENITEHKCYSNYIYIYIYRMPFNM